MTRLNRSKIDEQKRTESKKQNKIQQKRDAFSTENFTINKKNQNIQHQAVHKSTVLLLFF